jgi:hypothetical protein
MLVYFYGSDDLILQGSAWREDGYAPRDGETDVEPPPVQGGYIAKWGGETWDLVAPPIPVVDRKAEILAELAKIDAATDTPRARREALLGNTAWLTQQDAKAAALRAELATV